MPRVASVTDVIDDKDFETVWNFLETKFDILPNGVSNGNNILINKNADTHPVRDFLAFGCKNVDPLLNAVLCRNQYYATFSRMVFWLVRDRLVNVGWIRFSENETF